MNQRVENRRRLTSSSFLLTWTIAIAGLCFTPAFALANEFDHLITAEQARRSGLEVRWFTHVQVNPYRGKVAQAIQNINWQGKQTVYEVVYGRQREVYSERMLDALGEPVGIGGAQSRAEARAAILVEDGFDATVEMVELPEISLYFLTDTGMLQSIDGESGASRWATPIGNRDYPALPIAANDEFVAVVNGLDTFVVQAETGFIDATHRLRQSPGSGPVISDRTVLVPLFSGAVVAFELYDSEAPSERVVTVGRNFVQPMATDETISWGNDRSQLNVSFVDRLKNVAYRVQAGGDFLAPATPMEPDHLVACSSDGYVHFIREHSGRIENEISIGETLRKSAFVSEGVTYVCSAYDNLFRIPADGENYDLVVPNIKQVLMASETRVYCQGSDQTLVILDKVSGAVVDRVPADGIDLWFSNAETDRIFIGTSSGMIQCLTEAGSIHPRYNTVQDKDPEADEEEDGGRGSDNAFRARRR